MVKKNKKIIFGVIIIFLVLVAITLVTYFYKDSKAKEEYVEIYSICKSKAEQNPIRSAGGVKSISELQFVVNCFETKGCYLPCVDPNEPVYPGINFTETFKSSDKNSELCEKRCYYPLEHFNKSA
jgi:hypothetical protein